MQWNICLNISWIDLSFQIIILVNSVRINVTRALFYVSGETVADVHGQPSTSLAPVGGWRVRTLPPAMACLCLAVTGAPFSPRCPRPIHWRKNNTKISLTMLYITACRSRPTVWTSKVSSPGEGHSALEQGWNCVSTSRSLHWSRHHRVLTLLPDPQEVEQSLQEDQLPAPHSSATVINIHP